MVDVVDLLDDSSDEEAEEQQQTKTSVVSSSSWLRNVVSNGYQTGKSTVTATKSSVTPKRSASKESDDGDDEVLWIPTPIAKASSARKSSASKPAATATATAAAVLSNQKQPPINCRSGNDSSDGSDVEVLVVDPPKASAKSTSHAISSHKHSKSTPKSSFRASLKSSALDSDDDDDDDLMNYKPSGLTRTPRQSSESPIESWRKQFQESKGSASKPRVNPMARNSSSKKSLSQQKSVIRNPYAKTKTPPSVPSAPSRQTSGSSLIVDLHSPLAWNECRSNSASKKASSQQKSEIRNPYAKTKTPSSVHTSASSLSVDLNPPLARNPLGSSGSKSQRRPTKVTTAGAATSNGGVRPPKLRARTKTYPDLRPNIVLALWKFARKKLVCDSYQARRLDQFIGKIVDLVVAAPDFPIRSVGEYAIRKRGHLSKRGCGGLTISGDNLPRFEQDLNSTGVMEIRLSHLPGKYFSISEACLVAMKDTIVWRYKTNQSKQQQGHSQSRSFPLDESSQAALFSQKDYFVSLEDLIPLIDRRLRPECPSRLERSGDADKGASYYLNRSTRSAEFKQIEKLVAPVEIPKADGSVQTTSYLKKRTVGGRQHYQLMPLGYEKANVISKRSLPASPGPYRFCNLRNVLPKYERICLAVDFREGGGGDRYHKVLHNMCNKLDLQKIPYCVNTLRIGDYCFFSGDKLCPIIVERKSVEDVAKSIDKGDGRWAKQKLRMYQGQFVFGYQNCRIAYIIEGKLEKDLVSNNFVANARHKVSKERFEEEVSKLEGEGFEVLRTCSVENSMFQLSRWAESVARDVQSGKLKLKYTYDEFLREVDKIPKETDFSRLAKDHAKERKLATVDLFSDMESEGGREGGLSPIVLDKRLQKAEKRSAPKDLIETKSNMGARKRFKLDEKISKDSWGRFPEHNGYQAAISALSSHITADPIKTNASESNVEKNEYTKWTATALKEKCVELGMTKTGSKAELIKRLSDPSNRPPSVYRLRKERGLYVPTNLDTAPTAILVALQIQQDSAIVGVEKYGGATKEEIYTMAENIDIKKDPFCGGTTQTGPYHYDGWSSMKSLKQPGDPPLVVEKKRRFRLSTTGDVSGLKLARAMHIWCHKKGICKCTEHGYEFDPKKWK